jgi:sporulation protein YlmC with PRC-barrel domain
MKRLLALSAGALMIAGTAMAAGELMTSIPPSSLTVTDWYKQNVYDSNNNKIGEIMDVLVSSDGKIDALIVGVGGFVGAGEKDVAVNFDAVKKTTKNDKVYLTMNTSKDALKSAPGFKYDSQKTTWVPDTSSKATQ